MKYKIQNCRSKRLKQRLVKGLDFYTKELMHRNLSRNLFVTLVVDNKMLDYGERFVTNINDQYKPRKFVVKLNSSMTDPLCTLAHEMVHIKQYAKGELSPCHTKWKSMHINELNMKYLDLPWEKQAFRYDYQLYEKFLEFEQQNSKNFS